MIGAGIALEEFIHIELLRYAQGIDVHLKLGITGTRNGPAIQSVALIQTIGEIARNYPGTVEIHHGCCSGIDESSHNAGMGSTKVEIYGHPGTDARGNSPYRMRNMEAAKFHVLYPERVYTERNLAIVKSCSVLIACPRFPESDPRSLRSGTWQTVRYARRYHKPVIYITPDGRVSFLRAGI